MRVGDTRTLEVSTRIVAEGSLTVGDTEVHTKGVGLTIVGDLVIDLSIPEVLRS